MLIDKATFPRDKICAGAIGARGDKALAEIDVVVDVPSAYVRGLSVVAKAGALCERLDFDIGRVVRRRQYDAALLDHVRQRGVTVHQARFVSMERKHDRVVVETSAGSLSARCVVGADGVGSAVRRAIGIPRGDFHAQAVEVDTPWCDNDPPRDVLHFDICDRRHDGYAWDFPTLVDGELMVCRGVYQLGRGPDVAALLSERLRQRGFDPATFSFKRFAERGLSLYQPIGVERAMLVGEAAGIDPVLGEGIPQAILYGRAAGRYLARSGDFRLIGYRSALRSARVGIDLRIRSAATRWVYGRTRPTIERWVTSSRDLAHAGMTYFAGRRVDRRQLWRAVGGLLGGLVRGGV